MELGTKCPWRREQHSKLIPHGYASLSRRAAVLRRSLSMFGKESTFAGLSRTFPLVESNHAPLCQQNRSAFSPRCYRLRGPTVCVLNLFIKRHQTHKGTLWQRRWDSNPRGCYASTVFGTAHLCPLVYRAIVVARSDGTNTAPHFPSFRAVS